MGISELPESQRRGILWSTIVLIAAVLLIFWGRNVARDFQNLSLPQVPKELQQEIESTTNDFSFPSFEAPSIPSELLEELEQEYGEQIQ